MSFYEHGFLSDDMQNIRKKIRKDYEQFFLLSFKLNELAHKMKYSFIIPNNDPRKIIVGALLIKIIESFNASIILFESGLQSDAMSISRIILENSMKLIALINNDEYLQNYMLSEDYEEVRFAELVQHHKDHFDKTVLDKYGNISIQELKKKHKKPKKYEIYEIAALSNMEKIYYNAYTKLNSFVHSDIYSAREYINIDPSNDKYEYSITPKTDYLRLIFYTNFIVLCEVLDQLNKLFETTYKSEIDTLVQELDIIMESTNK